MDSECDDETSKEATKNMIDDGPWRVTWRAKSFGLAIITLLNLVQGVQSFILIGVIFDMAGELGFGIRQCRPDNQTVIDEYLNSTGDHSNTTADEFCADDGRCDANSSSFVAGACQLVSTGQGTKYDLLVGPVFYVIQGVATVPIISLIQAAGIRFSVAIPLISTLYSGVHLLTAFVNDYWAVALLRFLFGVLVGPISPLGYGYLTHLYKPERRTLIFGIVGYGYISGLGVAFLFLSASDVIGWRMCYVITGVCGVVLSLPGFFMVNPEHQEEEKMKPRQWSSNWDRVNLKEIAWSVLLPVIAAATCIKAFAVVYGYNMTNFLVEYFPAFNEARLTLITIVAAFPGCILGGMVADRLRRDYGVEGRLFLAVVLSVIIIGFGPTTFLVSPPVLDISYGFIILLGDWQSEISFSVISDITPLECVTVVFAIKYFATNSVGGALNLLVTPIASATDFRSSLVILASSLMSLCVLSFGVAFVCLKIRLARESKRDDRHSERTSLLGATVKN